jgi:hypothetical protein
MNGELRDVFASSKREAQRQAPPGFSCHETCNERGRALGRGWNAPPRFTPTGAETGEGRAAAGGRRLKGDDGISDLAANVKRWLAKTENRLVLLFFALIMAAWVKHIFGHTLHPWGP